MQHARYSNMKKIPQKEEKIPLPNKDEEKATPQKERNNLPFLDIFNNIGIEEILIVGLIFILITEGIEDQLLIILLLYILFF